MCMFSSKLRVLTLLSREWTTHYTPILWKNQRKTELGVVRVGLYQPTCLAPPVMDLKGAAHQSTNFNDHQVINFFFFCNRNGHLGWKYESPKLIEKRQPAFLCMLAVFMPTKKKQLKNQMSRFGLTASHRGESNGHSLKAEKEHVSVFYQFVEKPRRHLAASSTHTRVKHACILFQGNDYFPLMAHLSQSTFCISVKSSRRKRLQAVSLLFLLGH